MLVASVRPIGTQNMVYTNAVVDQEEELMMLRLMFCMLSSSVLISEYAALLRDCLTECS